LLRILWLARGGYETNINLKPQDLNNEFGDRLGCNFTASYIFKIDFDGNWTADFTFNFIENDNPWKYQDYSREESTSAKRARMLAIPNNKGEIVWNLRTYDKHLALIEQLKKTNFSFEFKYNSHGKWIRP